MTLTEELFARCEALGLKMSAVMLEAGVEPNCAYFWKKAEPKGLDKWYKMLAAEKKKVPAPGKPTASLFGEKALDVFMKHGYPKKEFDLRWAIRDSRTVENYKKVLSIIHKYENELHNRRSIVDAR